MKKLQRQHNPKLTIPNILISSLGMFAVIMILFTACKKDEEPTPTPRVDFEYVYNIVTTSCSFPNNGCHNGGGDTTNVTGLVLNDDIETVYNRIVGIASNTPGVTEKLINPGDPNTSYLYRKITRNIKADSTEGTIMPPAGPILEGEETALIKKWITDGAVR